MSFYTWFISLRISSESFILYVTENATISFLCNSMPLILYFVYLPIYQWIFEADSTFWLLGIMLLFEYVYTIFFLIMSLISIFQGRNPEMELLDYIAIVVFWEITILLFRAAIPFTVSSAVYRALISLHSHQFLLFPGDVCGGSHPKYEVLSHCGFHLIFLRTTGAEYIFKYLWSFGEKSKFFSPT